ncbi:MAG: VWA domain-containing protein [Chthoniobacteraceae bacterium]
MHWLHPQFLLIGLLIGLPILLHFLRKKPREMRPFPSLRFVLPSVLEHRRQHRILRWLVLAARCALILGFAAAFARPFKASPPDPFARAVIIAVDNSFSMQTKGRWEALRKWADQTIGSLGPGDRAGLLLMGPTPTWAVPLSENTGEVLAALRNLQPGYESVRYGPSLTLAAETLAHTPALVKAVVWMGDEQAGSWREVDFSKPLPPGINLIFPPAQPVPARQAAITGVISHPASIEVQIRLFSPARERRQVTITANGKATTQTVDLDAKKPASISLPLEPGVADWVRVALDPDDCPADDTAWVATRSELALSVILPSAPEPDFLRQAIAATEQKGLQALKIQPPEDAPWPLDAIAVVRGNEVLRPPLLNRLNAFLNAGGAAWVAFDGSLEQLAWLKTRGITASPIQGKPHLSRLDIDHPVFSALAESSLMPLLEPEFSGGYGLSGEGLSPLARWSEPAGSTVAIAETGHMVVSGFGLSRTASSLPISSAFVPLVHQILTYLGQAETSTHDSHLVVGHSVELPPQPGTWAAVDAPGFPGEPTEVNGSVVPPQPGLYRFTPGAANAKATPQPSAAGARLYAVNVADEESDLTPMKDAPWQKLQNHDPAPPPEASQSAQFRETEGNARKNANAWWWLAFAALVLLAAETALSNRTAL